MQPPLTNRERQVMEFVAKGLRNREAGARLNISARTVEIHRANAIRKLGAANTIEAIRILEGTQALPADVVRLVIAGRTIWEILDQGVDRTEPEVRELDRALEAFSERVPYDDEPEQDEAA